MTGVINHVIWVWPSWDTARHVDKQSRYSCEYGLTTVRKLDGNETKEFCICYSSNSPETKTPIFQQNQEQPRECYYLDRETNIMELVTDECIINKNINVTWEEVIESDFVIRLDRRDIFQPGEHVLIDIDEDFFGCERPVDEILHEGVLWDDLETINDYLASMICLQHTEQEQIADRFMARIIKAVVETCNVTCDTDSISIKANRILREYMAIDSTMFCRDSNTDMTVIQRASIILAKIMSILIKFSAVQLRDLLKLGFCSSTTLKGLIHQSGGAMFTICHGFTVPNMTVVSFSTPTHAQIENRATYLEIAMNHPNLQSVELVTLCRSIRDGYTPRKHFKLIEDGIVAALNTTGSKESSIFYDPHLLGGKQGWYNRFLSNPL